MPSKGGSLWAIVGLQLLNLLNIAISLTM